MEFIGDAGGLEKARVKALLGCSHTGYEFQQERAEIQGVYNPTMVQLFNFRGYTYTANSVGTILQKCESGSFPTPAVVCMTMVSCDTGQQR